MKFIDALMMLKEGGCEGIFRGSVPRRIIINENNELEYAVICSRLSLTSDEIEACDWEMYNKPVTPQYEDVEVTRYLRVCGNTEAYFGCIPVGANKDEFVKLSGTVKPEIKPKVKHREFYGYTEGYKSSSSAGYGDIKPNTALYAEWED